MAKNFRGFVEKCDSTIGIVGWFLDKDQPDLSVQVDIFVDDNFLCQVPADVFRQDLLDAGFGNGKHGFRIAVPDKFFDDTEHVFALGADGVVVPSSAKTFLLPPKTFVPIILGNVDSCDEQGIRGWIVYENDLQRVVSVDVVIDDELIVTTAANLFRKDLTNFRDGKCAFNVPIPGKFWDGVEHIVTAYEVETKAVLHGSSKTFKLFPKVHGAIDRCDKTGIVGWVVNESNLSQPVEIDIFIDDELIAHATANLFRQDLFDVKLGNGNCGFSVAIPNKFWDGVEHRVGVYDAATKRILIGSKTFQIDVIGSKIIINKIENDLHHKNQELKKENELLLLQLNKIQEELECYYLQWQQADAKVKELTLEREAQIKLPNEFSLQILAQERDQLTIHINEQQSILKQFMQEREEQAELLKNVKSQFEQTIVILNNLIMRNQ